MVYIKLTLSEHLKFVSIPLASPPVTLLTLPLCHSPGFRTITAKRLEWMSQNLPLSSCNKDALILEGLYLFF